MMWYNNREPSWYNQELGLSYLNLNVLLLLLHFTLSVYTKETNGQQHPKWRNNWGQVCPSHNVVWRPSVIVFSSSSFPYVFHFLRSRCAKTFHRVLFCFFSKDRCPPYYQWSLGKERREKRSSQVPVVVFFFVPEVGRICFTHTHTHTPEYIDDFQSFRAKFDRPQSSWKRPPPYICKWTGLTAITREIPPLPQLCRVFFSLKWSVWSFATRTHFKYRLRDEIFGRAHLSAPNVLLLPSPHFRCFIRRVRLPVALRRVTNVNRYLNHTSLCIYLW